MGERARSRMRLIFLGKPSLIPRAKSSKYDFYRTRHLWYLTLMWARQRWQQKVTTFCVTIYVLLPPLLEGSAYSSLQKHPIVNKSSKTKKIHCCCLFSSLTMCQSSSIHISIACYFCEERRHSHSWFVKGTINLAFHPSAQNFLPTFCVARVKSEKCVSSLLV